MDFITELGLVSGSWEALERTVCRLLLCEGYTNVRMTGKAGDKGADLIATKFNQRWLFQVKHWNKPIGTSVVDETLSAMRFYDADVSVIVSLKGADSFANERQFILRSEGIKLMIWSASTLVERFSRLPKSYFNTRQVKDYQKTPIESVVQSFYDEYDHHALVVMATGLGKTFVAAESVRRINEVSRKRVLVLAHTIPLVLQLEKSFWPFLYPDQSTIVWDGNEKPSDEMLKKSDFVFACIDTVSNYLDNDIAYDFDIIVVDECHHAGSSMYVSVLEHYKNDSRKPFIMGMTATPWRQEYFDLSQFFGECKVKIDMVEGMKKGYLANVDYRMHTDNINWDSLKNVEGKTYSPKEINRKFFIDEWDDAVIEELQKTWSTVPNPRAIIFCGTIGHAESMCDRIRGLSFCNIDVMSSKRSPAENNKILCDFSDNRINAICTVDMFNEGIDVPDVNIIVFQRVTHSRRIFIQQLGRGLRISDDKEKVIVLDFVSDIRRFAAGLDLKTRLVDNGERIRLHSKVTFKRVGGDDPKAESFLKKWLDDIAGLEELDEDASVLVFPPKIDGE